MNIESLVMLYLNNQDLKGKTPEEIYLMHKQAEVEFQKAEKDNRPPPRKSLVNADI